MAENFWTKLPKPFFCLAPMDDVTDTVLRQMLLVTGRPDVFFTEFVNVDGLNSQGRRETEKRLKYTTVELPLVAQIWGNRPDNFNKSAKIIAGMGFSGIDINMGCAIADVVRRGSGAGLIGKFDEAAAIIKAVRQGAGGLPVSVKTRNGNQQVKSHDWISFLLKQGLDALSIHARQPHQGYNLPADWEAVAEAVKLRDKLKAGTLVIGNGDVQNHADGVSKVSLYGADGVMIARAVLTDIQVFARQPKVLDKNTRRELLRKHLELFMNTWGEGNNFASLKKFIKLYINGFPSAQEMRMEMMSAQSPLDLQKIITKYD